MKAGNRLVYTAAFRTYDRAAGLCFTRTVTSAGLTCDILATGVPIRMAQTAIRLTTRTLPGRRIDVTVPQLNEGDEVELIILKPGVEHTIPTFTSALEYLDSLPPLTRTPEEWAEIERELQEEKDAWER